LFSFQLYVAKSQELNQYICPSCCFFPLFFCLWCVCQILEHDAQVKKYKWFCVDRKKKV
jgi:hypothetical protein